MSRTIADFINFGKQYLRSKVGLFFALIFPILLILLFGAIFTGGGSTKYILPIQNLDDGYMGTNMSEIFMQSLNDTKFFDIQMIPDNEDIQGYISNNSLSFALRIPQEFSAQILLIQATNGSGHVNVTFFMDPSKSSAQTAYGIIGAVSQQMNFALADAKPIIGSDVQTIGTDAFNFMDFFIPGIIGMTVMTNALYAMTGTCADYRQRSYFKLLATTNIKKYEWLISKFIFWTLLLWGAMILTYIVGVVAFDMNSVLTPMAFVFIAAGAFTFTSMGMLLGTVVKDPEGAAAIANAIGFPMMFLSGSFFQLEAAPEYLQTIAAALPLTYLNEGLRATMVYGNEMTALINLVVVLVWGIVFFLLASRFMSWKEK